MRDENKDATVVPESVPLPEDDSSGELEESASISSTPPPADGPQDATVDDVPDKVSLPSSKSSTDLKNSAEPPTVEAKAKADDLPEPLGDAEPSEPRVEEE